VTPGEFHELLLARANTLEVIVTAEIAERLQAYFEILAHWNRRINLTSLPLDPPTAQSIDRLLIEPIAASDFVARSVSMWFDLGSGGGSPAIPLNFVRPAERLAMVESRERKAAFLRETIRELQLGNAEVMETRIETLAEQDRQNSTADLVTVRAVRLSASLFSHLDSLLMNGGKAILFGTAPQRLDLPRGLEIQHVEPRLVVLRRIGV
jgi:16S rRNA (guanine(527)-N(7))-methyltransferase RsmG